jgi:dCMP deaminase
VANKNQNNQPIAVMMYVPVIHQGYLKLLTLYPQLPIWVLGDTVRAEFRTLVKDIRSLTAQQAKTALGAMFPGRTIEVLELTDLANLQARIGQGLILVPEETELHELMERFELSNLVQWENIFLRWHRENTLEPEEVVPGELVTQDEFAQKVMGELAAASRLSPDWWRQVAAAIIKDHTVILQAHNEHMPLPEQTAYDGDPRASFHKKDHFEYSTAQHAEASLVAQAARDGVSLAGADLFVTTFPCPVCAKLVSQTGIKKLYYQEGYSLVHGADVLQAAGIELVRVIKS